MSDMPERLLAWPSVHNYQRVSLAGGRPNDAVEYVRTNALTAVQPTVSPDVGAARKAQDEAEAALAAQIEVDAGIADMLVKSAEAAMQLATDADHSVKVGVASQKAMAQRISALIRSQPHDRTALDRHDAKTREKALREAAEILDEEGWLGMSKHRILALIEEPNAR